MIYLNNASTTKVDKKVLEDFIYATKTYWQNPSDISQGGLEAKNIIEDARNKIATAIGANGGNEIVFTSGGSESNNFAIKGYLDRYKGIKNIITTKIEHPSVYNTCQYLGQKGYRVEYVPIDGFGMVDVNRLEDLICNNNLLYPLVSIIMANNEIGTINNIASISKVVHTYGGVLHVDATQAFMHTYIDVEDLGIDMMTASFHKIGGFKNCGFLYIKDGIELTPLIHGGKQFEYKRSGTENIPAIYAFGNQVERLNDDLGIYLERSKDLYNHIIQEVYEKCGKYCDVRLNGHPLQRIYNNLSFTFVGINAEHLITLLDMRGIQISSGSACCSGSKVPSRTLKAIGLSDEEAFSTVRISFGYETSTYDVDEFVDVLAECIRDLKMFG